MASPKKKAARPKTKKTYFKVHPLSPDKSALRPHPAAESADSDTVRLVKEVEALRIKIGTNEERRREFAKTISRAQESARETEQVYLAHIEAAERELRVLQSQLMNAEEVLGNALNPRVGRRCATEAANTIRGLMAADRLR